jgi:hypothetical protein
MKPSARSVAFGAFAAGLLGLSLVFGLGSAGCDSQQLAPTPDASLPECNHGPFIFCSATTDDQPHCSTDDQTSSPTYIARLPKSTLYPVGCSINFVGDRDTVNGGDCKLEQVCHCVLPDLVVPDAGPTDDGGAASPAPTSTGNPVWQCG